MDFVKERIRWFRLLDLSLLSALGVVSSITAVSLLETLSSRFYFDFSIAISLIAMIRWGSVGVVVAALSSVPTMLHSDMEFFAGVLFYMVGNLSLGVPILVYGSRKRDWIVAEPFRLCIYILLSHLCLAVGKGLAILLLTGENTGIIDYFGATCFVLVMNVVVCLVLRLRKDLICDMRYYFLGGECNGKYRN